MKKLLYLCMLVGYTAFAQSSSLFEQANQAYSEGNYEEAIEYYNEILQNGETSVELHYNLGNAHYKLNEVAPSIYHFEKALQLDPSDEDVQNNLHFAQNMAIDEIVEPTPTDFQRWQKSVLELFGVTGWGWVSIIGIFLFSLLFTLYYFSRSSLKKRIYFIGGIIFLFLGIGAIFLGYSKKTFQEEQTHSIVFAEEVVVRSEPNRSSSEVFTLHAGAKVEVLEDFQGWSKVQLPSGAQGWMEQEHIKNL